MNTFSLFLQVAIQRQRLEDLIAKHGLEDERVLAQSQKLDKLILEIQRRLIS